MAALRALVNDDLRRREWLWLRGHMKNDDTLIESIERADPTLPSRMLWCIVEAEAAHDPRERAAIYGRLLDERSPLRSDEACSCPACVSEDWEAERARPR